MASLFESAVSGEAFLTQANWSVITLGGSTSTEREQKRDGSQEEGNDKGEEEKKRY